MTFSCGKTCVLVAVFILTAFVCVAMSTGHRELFEMATSHSNPSDSHANNTYKYIDENDTGVCYPSELSQRSTQSNLEPCTSVRFQNPAYIQNQIFLGDGSSTNPFSLVEFSNGETLENGIMSTEVKNKVEGLLEKQEENYDDIVERGKTFETKLENARKLYAESEEEKAKVTPYQVKTVNGTLEGIPSFDKVPTLDSGKTRSPCINKKCEYVNFKYTNNEYGPIGNNVGNVIIPPKRPNNARAMFISNVQSPNLILFQDTCPLPP